MKNSYSVPHLPHNEEDWMEDEYYKSVFTDLYAPDGKEEEEHRRGKKNPGSEDGWRHNGVKHDMYHLPQEGEDYVEDAYTVGQKFEDRTQFQW